MEEFPLHRSAENDDLERVKQLFEDGVSVDSRDNYGVTPLHLAAVHNRYEVTEFLISSKCDLNLKDRYGDTPVVLAAKWAEKDCVDLLLQRGAQVHCVNIYNSTLLHHASFNSWGDVVQRILGSGEADPNVADCLGQTPLMRGARGGDKDVAKLLIGAGADVNPIDKRKWTALHWAALTGSSEFTEVLLEKEGLDLNPQDEYGKTPLRIACSRTRPRFVRQLLVAGADANIKDNRNETALNVGIRRKSIYVEEIRLFVQRGAVLEYCDYERISRNSYLKENLLKDVDFCTQSIVNKFHRHSLPVLKSNPYFAAKLPSIEKFYLNASHIQDVENFVKCDIESKTFCNPVKARPMILSVLCVQSLISQI